MILRRALQSCRVVAVVTTLFCAPAAFASAAAAPPSHQTPATSELLDYLRSRNTTGFLVIQNGRTLIEENWPAPKNDPQFSAFVYERNADGALLEDVASQQKSFVAVLVAIAIDKGILDVAKPVSAYLGVGWSKASAEQEARIRVIDVLTMSTGLDPRFGYAAPPGTTFFYNTPVYAVTKRILEVAAKQPLDRLTHDWLTEPASMRDTAWRARPTALADVGNPIGLVTSPRDIARFGRLILRGGISDGGARVVSKTSLAALFERSASNPSYGRLWWLNGGSFTVGAAGVRRDGNLIPEAPADLIAALGALDRRLYIVPSLDLIVVRTGAATDDPMFDRKLWALLRATLKLSHVRREALS